jgi:hypothetical protein
LEEQGVEAFIGFHARLLQLFQDELEPAWGHLHKGHFYMRLGLAYLAQDIPKASEYFERGYKEDRLLCKGFYEAGHVPDGEIRARLSPNYVSLVVIERSRPEFFDSPLDRQTYFAGVSRLRMEVFWEPHPAEPHPILSAIRKLIPQAQQEAVLRAYHELRYCESLGMTHALPPLVCAFIRKVLLNLLWHQANEPETTATTLRQADVLDLLRLADKRHLIPKNSLISYCRMAAIMEKELRLVLPEDHHYPIDPVTERRIGHGLKALLDKALIEWAG